MSTRRSTGPLPRVIRDPMHRLRDVPQGVERGPLVVIGLKGSRARREMINSLKLFSHVPNVGDRSRSRSTQPRRRTRSFDEEQIETGLPPEPRLSVGIEHIDDIIKDLNQALAQIEVIKLGPPYPDYRHRVARWPVRKMGDSKTGKPSRILRGTATILRRTSGGTRLSGERRRRRAAASVSGAASA